MVFNDVAQICLNGHLINASSKTYPGSNKKFCPDCGEATITKCPNCVSEIEGQIDPECKWDIPTFRKVPSYCPNCGHPYPWTETKIQAALNYIEELEGISKKEKEKLSRNFDDLIKDTPNTELAATRFKKILIGSKNFAFDTFRSILVDIVTDKAGRILGF